jgi:glutathione peroxidase
MKADTLSGLVLLTAMAPVGAESGIYGINVEDINGSLKSLGDYRGNVILAVNVASKCGFTYQYESLEALYQKYKDQGFVVLGFPSNDFLRQEPGSNEEIREFCSLNYGVTFPMFAKIKVKGRRMHPLYRYLTSAQTNPEYPGRITWNFNKFLINSSGEIINRFGSKEEPDSPAVIRAIEEALEMAKGRAR